MALTSTDIPVRNYAKRHEKMKGSHNLSMEDIELIKIEFNEKLHKHFLSTKNAEEFSIMSNLKSSITVDSMIQKIKNEVEKSRLDSTYTNIYHDKYKTVQCKDVKERLFCKDKDLKFKIILPWEEIFDIYWETHVKHGHPEAKTLKKILQRAYIVNDFAIQSLTEVCYVCFGPRKPYYYCSLDLVSMAGTDFAFSHLMVYQDINTGFIHLRPLCADNKDSEVCVELFRIFMDFGPPKQIFVSDEIFVTALEQINHITTYAPISIEIIKVYSDYMRLNQLRKKIRAWMVANNFDNWCLACYGFQYQVNKDNKHGKKSPYDSVFKKITNCVVENLTEVKFDSSEFSNPSIAKIVDKRVSTRLPIVFNAVKFLTGTSQASPDSHSLDEVQEIPCTSEIPSVKRTSTAVETEFKAGSASRDSCSSDEVQEIPGNFEVPSTARTSTAMETESNAASTSFDLVSSDDEEEVEEYELTSNEGSITSIETEFDPATQEDMLKSEDKDPLAID